MFEIGNYKLSSIEAGKFALDGGAMFGVIPKELWKKKIPSDERNRIPMRTRLLLIQSLDKNILVDTGCGDKFDAKFKDIYKIDYSKFSLEKGLNEHLLTTNDITDVILTHLHFDHAGGATKKSASGKIVPTFPNAKYYVQKTQLNWAKAKNERDRASFLEENFVPLEKTGQLIAISGVQEIYPGIKTYITSGHTDGQQNVVVTDGNGTLFFCADLIPTSVHVGLPWIMGYDLWPLETLKEKKLILEEAANKNWVLFFEHCPLIAAAHVKKTDNGFELYDELESL